MSWPAIDSTKVIDTRICQVIFFKLRETFSSELASLKR